MDNSQDQIVEDNIKRAQSAEIEKLLGKKLPVLDHGFIRVIDYMGDDNAVVQAARVSYGKGTKKVNEDRGLIFYLMRHQHTTPFEMCELKLHVKLPIFIARQWIRHRTASVNEYSARYSVLNKEFYLPDAKVVAPQSATNKQGRQENDQASIDSQRIMEILKDDAELCYLHYQEMLNQDSNGNPIDSNKIGIARELARMNLNLNYYTEWYWKINLHNLLHFLALRIDPHAQYEIRVYAELILDIVKKWVPITYEAFMEYRVGGASFSASAISLIKARLAGRQITQEESKMSKREWDELNKILSYK